MKILQLAISPTAPSIRNCAWLQPVKGGVVLRILNNGRWENIKLVNDKGTPTPADDDVNDIIEVENIEALTNEQLDRLNVGDTVIKITGKQKHLYFVTYKGEGPGEGICLSYNDAGYGETVAYDRIENGWQFNSTDKKTYGQ